MSGRARVSDNDNKSTVDDDDVDRCRSVELDDIFKHRSTFHRSPPPDCWYAVLFTPHGMLAPGLYILLALPFLFKINI